MCGIFALIVAPGTGVTASAFTDAVTLLLRLSERRGRDSTGVAVRSVGAMHVLKRPVAAVEFVRTHEYCSMLGSNAKAVAHGVVAIGICRLATSGTRALPHHNQPVQTDRIVGVHNGVLCMTDAVTAPEAQTDTERMLAMVDASMGAGSDITAAMAMTFAAVEGSATVIAADSAGAQVVAATNTGSLYLARDARRRITVLASEEAILRVFLARASIAVGGEFTIDPIGAGQGLRITAASLTSEPFAVSLSRAHGASAPRPRPGPARPRTKSAVPLKVCTRCLLPETHPFLEFDGEGVCSLCRSWRNPAPLAGEAALEEVLARHRRTDGRPDCIAAFSGGRDSSYGLHLLVTKYKMKPLALTYDWGFVTDHARRNQARMCATLGVEHVVRAADIERKRRDVRENVLAWLDRPVLGMIPLFSAGDKAFYGFARALRRETDIGLVVLFSHELERTEFKTGFCGIRENDHRNVLYRFSWFNKFRLAAWFGAEYVRNPGYLNLSLAGSVAAFGSTFLARDNFLYPYHYVPWIEEQVVGTLTDRYGWEPDPDTGITWRNGDGYTAFTNYIYSRLAGFSEYDVLRSNQIRAGLLTRENAARLSEHENQPRAELFDFAEWIGLDCQWLLDRIDEIGASQLPKRHRVLGPN